MRNRITYLLACLVVSSGSLAQSIYKDNSYSKAGKQKELADIFAKFGCKKLSDFDSRTEDYPALMKELVSVNG